MFSVRLVNADSYQSPPIAEVDPTYSDFRGAEIKHVPIIRIFGSTPKGEKTCLHVHGVFPYMYVPYTGGEDSCSLAYRLAASLDAAINVSLSSASSRNQHVYKVQRISGIPFYGYHRKEHQFFKVYFYNPAMIKRAADLLQNGAVLNQSLQPHEAHIPFIQQFMIDYNLHGMNLVNLKSVKHRLPTAKSASQTDSSSESTFSSSVISDGFMADSVVRQSTCKLEVDALASDILNRETIEREVALNPGLAAIWEEEKARRLQAGLQGSDSQLVNPKSPVRPPLQLTENDVYQQTRLAQRLLFISQCDESTLSATPDLSSYPIETQEINNLLNASCVEHHVGPNSQKKASRDHPPQNINQIINHDVALSLATSSVQKLNQSLDCSVLDADDMPVLDMLTELALENATGKSVDDDSVLGSQPLVPESELKSDDSQDDEAADFNLTCLQLDTLSSSEFIEKSSNQSQTSDSKHKKEASQGSTNLGNLSVFDLDTDSSSDATFCENIPQFDGAGDVSKSEKKKQKSTSHLDSPAHSQNSSIKNLNCLQRERLNPSKIPEKYSRRSETSDKKQKNGMIRDLENESCFCANIPQFDGAGDVLTSEKKDQKHSLMHNKMAPSSTKPGPHLQPSSTQYDVSFDLDLPSVLSADLYLDHYGGIFNERFESLPEVEPDFESSDLENLQSTIEIGMLSPRTGDNSEASNQSVEKEEIPLEMVLTGDPCFTESAVFDKSDLTELQDQYVSLLDSALLPDVHTSPINEVENSSQAEDESKKPVTGPKLLTSGGTSPSENITPNIQHPEYPPYEKNSRVKQRGAQREALGDSSDYNCNVVATWEELQNLRFVEKQSKRKQSAVKAGEILVNRETQNNAKGDRRRSKCKTDQSEGRFVVANHDHGSAIKILLKREKPSDAEPRRSDLNRKVYRSGRSKIAKVSKNQSYSFYKFYKTKNATCQRVPVTGPEYRVRNGSWNEISLSPGEILEYSQLADALPSHLCDVEDVRETLTGVQYPSYVVSGNQSLAEAILADFKDSGFDEDELPDATDLELPVSPDKSVTSFSFYSSRRSNDRSAYRELGHRHYACRTRRTLLSKHIFTANQIWVIEKQKRGRTEKAFPEICTSAECRLPVVFLEKLDLEKKRQDLGREKLEESVFDEDFNFLEPYEPLDLDTSQWGNFCDYESETSTRVFNPASDSDGLDLDSSWSVKTVQEKSINKGRMSSPQKLTLKISGEKIIPSMSNAIEKENCTKSRLTRMSSERKNAKQPGTPIIIRRILPDRKNNGGTNSKTRLVVLKFGTKSSDENRETFTDSNAESSEKLVSQESYYRGLKQNKINVQYKIPISDGRQINLQEPREEWMIHQNKLQGKSTSIILQKPKPYSIFMSRNNSAELNPGRSMASSLDWQLPEASESSAGRTLNSTKKRKRSHKNIFRNETTAVTNGEMNTAENSFTTAMNPLLFQSFSDCLQKKKSLNGTNYVTNLTNLNHKGEKDEKSLQKEIGGSHLLRHSLSCKSTTRKRPTVHRKMKNDSSDSLPSLKKIEPSRTPVTSNSHENYDDFTVQVTESTDTRTKLKILLKKRKDCKTDNFPDKQNLSSSTTEIVNKKEKTKKKHEKYSGETHFNGSEKRIGEYFKLLEDRAEHSFSNLKEDLNNHDFENNCEFDEPSFIKNRDDDSAMSFSPAGDYAIDVITPEIPKCLFEGDSNSEDDKSAGSKHYCNYTADHKGLDVFELDNISDEGNIDDEEGLEENYMKKDSVNIAQRNHDLSNNMMRMHNEREMKFTVLSDEFENDQCSCQNLANLAIVDNEIANAAETDYHETGNYSESEPSINSCQRADERIGKSSLEEIGDLQPKTGCDQQKNENVNLKKVSIKLERLDLSRLNIHLRKVPNNQKEDRWNFLTLGRSVKSEDGKTSFVWRKFSDNKKCAEPRVSITKEGNATDTMKECGNTNNNSEEIPNTNLEDFEKKFYLNIKLEKKMNKVVYFNSNDKYESLLDEVPLQERLNIVERLKDVESTPFRKMFETKKLKEQTIYCDSKLLYVNMRYNEIEWGKLSAKLRFMLQFGLCNVDMKHLKFHPQPLVTACLQLKQPRVLLNRLSSSFLRKYYPSNAVSRKKKITRSQRNDSNNLRIPAFDGAVDVDTEDSNDTSNNRESIYKKTEPVENKSFNERKNQYKQSNSLIKQPAAVVSRKRKITHFQKEQFNVLRISALDADSDHDIKVESQKNLECPSNSKPVQDVVLDESLNTRLMNEKMTRPEKEASYSFRIPAFDGAADPTSEDSDSEPDVTVESEENRICEYKKTLAKSALQEKVVNVTPKKRKSADLESPSKRRNVSPGSSRCSPKRTNLLRSPGCPSRSYSPLNVIVKSPKVCREAVESSSLEVQEANLQEPFSICNTPRRSNRQLREKLLRERLTTNSPQSKRVIMSSDDEDEKSEQLGELTLIPNISDVNAPTNEAVGSVTVTDTSECSYNAQDETTAAAAKSSSYVRKKLVFPFVDKKLTVTSIATDEKIVADKVDRHFNDKERKCVEGSDGRIEIVNSEHDWRPTIGVNDERNDPQSSNNWCSIIRVNDEHNEYPSRVTNPINALNMRRIAEIVTTHKSTEQHAQSSSNWRPTIDTSNEINDQPSSSNWLPTIGVNNEHNENSSDWMNPIHTLNMRTIARIETAHKSTEQHAQYSSNWHPTVHVNDEHKNSQSSHNWCPQFVNSEQNENPSTVTNPINTFNMGRIAKIATAHKSTEQQSSSNWSQPIEANIAHDNPQISSDWRTIIDETEERNENANDTKSSKNTERPIHTNTTENDILQNQQEDSKLNTESDDSESEEHAMKYPTSKIKFKTTSSENCCLPNDVQDTDDEEDDLLNMTFTQYIDDQITKKHPEVPVHQIKNCSLSQREIVIMPRFNPPGYQTIKESMEMHGIPQCRNQEPFFSNHEDVMAQKEVAHKMLKIPSKSAADLQPFKSELEDTTGIRLWRRMKVNEFHPSGAKLKSSKLRRSLAGHCDVVIIPLLAPPTQKNIKTWLRAKEYLKKKKEEAEEREKQRRNKLLDDPTCTSLPGTPNSDIIGTSQEKDIFAKQANIIGAFQEKNVPAEQTNLQDEPTLYSTSECRGIREPQRIATREKTRNEEFPRRKDEKHDKLLESPTCTLRESLPGTPNSDIIEASPEKEACESLAEETLRSTPGSCRISESRRMTVREKIQKKLMLQSMEKICSVEEESSEDSQPSYRSDASVDASLRKALENSKLYKDCETARILGKSCGQIEASTQAAQFKVPCENLKAAKALTTHQYLTLLCLEVHIVTRGDLLPDPQRDSIRALFYAIHNDVPSTSDVKPLEYGCIVFDPKYNSSNKKSGHLHGSGVTCPVSYTTSEEALLDSLVDLISRHDPDILLGWELEYLSWGYIFQRAAVLGINLAPRVSRIPSTKKAWETHTPDLDALSEIKLPGRVVLDIWRLMRHEIALQSYTFESVMYHVMHERLSCPSYVTLTCWWNHRSPRMRWMVVDYYTTKVLGTLNILDQLDLVGRTSELARLFGIQFYEVFSRGSQFRVESIMLRLAKPANYVPVSPSIQQRASMRAPECIPLIMEPESVFYSDPLIVLDFQSLYPSIIIAYNYCFSTCLGRIEHIGQPAPFEFGATTLKVTENTALQLEGKLNFSPCAVAFVNSEVRRGIMPRMLSEILETRLMVKKAMKDHSHDDHTLQRALHSRQLGLKLIANVTYGYTAANFSGRMPCIEVGDSVVSKGRETLERAIKIVESTPRWGARVVYGDTDSLFVLLPGKSREQAFEVGAEIADTVTAANPKPVKLKFEKVLQPSILQTKKRYCGYMYESLDQEKPVYLAKGIETVRRDGCPAVAKILEKTLKILFETKDVSQVKSYVTRQLDKVLRGRVSIQDLTFAREFRGMQGYKSSACVPALELTRRLTQKDPRAVPRSSERVPYVIVAGAPNQALIQCVRSPWELFNDPGLRPNALYYITRVIIPPLNRCLNLFGADANAWFAEMPHRHVINMPSTSIGDKQKSTISQYFGTVACAACGRASNKGICTDCLALPSKTLVMLHEKIRQVERTYCNINMICQSCMGRADNTDCASLDCPVLYRRAQAKRDLCQTSYLHQIIQSGNNLEF